MGALRQKFSLWFPPQSIAVTTDPSCIQLRFLLNSDGVRILKDYLDIQEQVHAFLLRVAASREAAAKSTRSQSLITTVQELPNSTAFIHNSTNAPLNKILQIPSIAAAATYELWNSYLRVDPQGSLNTLNALIAKFYIIDPQSRLIVASTAKTDLYKIVSKIQLMRAADNTNISLTSVYDNLIAAVTAESAPQIHDTLGPLGLTMGCLHLTNKLREFGSDQPLGSAAVTDDQRMQFLEDRSSIPTMPYGAQQDLSVYQSLHQILSALEQWQNNLIMVLGDRFQPLVNSSRSSAHINSVSFSPSIDWTKCAECSPRKENPFVVDLSKPALEIHLSNGVTMEMCLQHLWGVTCASSCTRLHACRSHITGPRASNNPLAFLRGVPVPATYTVHKALQQKNDTAAIQALNQQNNLDALSLCPFGHCTDHPRNKNGTPGPRCRCGAICTIGSLGVEVKECMSRPEYDGFSQDNIHMPRYCLTQKQLRTLAQGERLTDKPKGDPPTGGKPKSGKPSGGKHKGHSKKASNNQKGDALKTQKEEVATLKKQVSDLKELKATLQEKARLEAEIAALSCDDSKDE